MSNNTDNTQEQSEKHFKHFEQQANAKIHHFYLSKVIAEPDNYVEMIHHIKTAGPQDLIYIYLNTSGGQVNTGVQIIAAMRMSGAHIITVVEGEVCSLGTLIFLSGDEMICQEGSIFMIHNHSSGQVGKGHEYLAQAQATAKWFEELARSTYVGFLTEDEFNRMIKGEDFWFNTTEVRKRLVKYCKYLKKQMDDKEAKKK